MELAMFGAGCFWGVEAGFKKILGVVQTTVGYSGGETKNPQYEQVCTGKTGHVEVVQLEFDSRKVSYGQLLDVFWACHDPTSVNSQGLDRGTQYKSVIFYHTEDQKRCAQASKKTEQKKYTKKMVTEILPIKKFYQAEGYHQNYLEKHGKVC